MIAIEKGPHVQIIENGIQIIFNDRRYILKNINYGDYQLKANIKAQPTNAPDQRLHIDIVNLYSSTARRAFIKNCTSLFAEDFKVIEDDLNAIINILEEKKSDLKNIGSGQQNTKLEIMTDQEREEALAFLHSPALFEDIVNDLSALGYVGEDTNKLTAYLAVTSRKLDDPLSIMISSRSAAGKSSLQDAILALLPSEDFVKYTSLTGKALYYQDEYALQNKVLAIEEEAGSKEASYSLRAIQSAKHLSIATTGRDSSTGKLKTEVYQVKGPVCIFFTTSNVTLDQETANRFLRLTVDESQEQTKRIFERQRILDDIDGLFFREKADKIIRKHHNAQRLLAPIRVINPFAKDLTFNHENLRTRRDHKKYLTLIKAITFLKQHQRSQKSVSIQGKNVPYIEVTPDDIQQANQLAKQIFAHTLEELSPPSRTLLVAIEQMVKQSINGNGTKPDDFMFTRKNIRDFTYWSNYQVKNHIKELEDLEYLVPVSGGPRKRLHYQLNNSSNNGHLTINLVDAASLVSKSGKLGESGCRPDFDNDQAKNINLGAGRQKKGGQ